MPARAKISTKTTRNEEFNYYIDETIPQNPVMNTVTSATATKNNRNIKLLDVNDAIIKKGNQIADDARMNTTVIEISLKLDSKTAQRAAYFAITGEPHDAKERKEYDNIELLLLSKGSSYEKVATMVINYENDNVLNTDAGLIFNDNTNYYIFGAPEQVILNNRQHYNNCGIESTLNNLAMSGIVKMNKNLSDQEKVEKSFLESAWVRNLAGDAIELGVLNEDDGGTYPDDYRDIMEYFGIESKSYYMTTKSDEKYFAKNKINELAYKISQGYGAILCVCSSVLWNNAQSETGKKQIDHAIAITGVVYATNNIEPQNPEEYVAPVGFYVHDTGAWMTRFISYDEFIEATLCDYVYGPEDSEEDKTLKNLRTYDSRIQQYIEKDGAGIFVTLTDAPIKVDTFNLDVTGDKYANQLWGNNSDNLVKGMAGNDTLYGHAGRDTIRGGAGHDVIVGNNAYRVTIDPVGIDYTIDTVEDFKDYLVKADVLSHNIETILDELEVDDYDTITVEQFLNFDTIIPNGVNDIYGDAGDDIIIGGEFADLIYGGAGNDYVWGGFGRNAIYGGAGHDVIVGGFDNDRLFGDAGNDTIFGLEDADVISAGAGNDHVWGGSGSDMIDVGAGNDTVYFEGPDYGQDEIVSKSGNTVLKFVDEDGVVGSASSASDMFFSLDDDKNGKNVKNLLIKYTQGDLEGDESGVYFKQYLKSGSAKSLYVDAADGMYKVALSGKSKATVANTKTKGSTKINGEKYNNEDINNILITTCTKGTNITTSTKNDIVTMASVSGLIYDGVVDSITYTGGVDKYVSEERDTWYYIKDDITADTSLSIYDNVIANESAQGFYVSENDALFLKSGDFNYLFDVSILIDDHTYAVTTQNTGLYLLDGDIDNIYASIVQGDAAGGFIYMDSFFNDEQSVIKDITVPTVGEDFYGNGQIEHMYCNNQEHLYNADLTTIAGQVAGWLMNGTYNVGGYESAFEAFANFGALTEEAQTALVGAYTTYNA